jgi:hypothetical protein
MSESTFQFVSSESLTGTLTVRKWWEFQMLSLHPGGGGDWPSTRRGWATLVWNVDVFWRGRVPVLKLFLLLALILGGLSGAAIALLLR